jgi:hypothetical protein
MMPLELATETLQNLSIRLTEKEPNETEIERVFIEFVDTATDKTYGTVTLFTPIVKNKFGDSCLFGIKEEFEYTDKQYDFLKGFDAVRAIQKHTQNKPLMQSLSEICN